MYSVLGALEGTCSMYTVKLLKFKSLCGFVTCTVKTLVELKVSMAL